MNSYRPSNTASSARPRASQLCPLVVIHFREVKPNVTHRTGKKFKGIDVSLWGDSKAEDESADWEASKPVWLCHWLCDFDR